MIATSNNCLMSYETPLLPPGPYSIESVSFLSLPPSYQACMFFLISNSQPTHQNLFPRQRHQPGWQCQLPSLPTQPKLLPPNSTNQRSSASDMDFLKDHHPPLNVG